MALLDRGGTFTDVIERAPDGSVVSRKVLSENPPRYRDPALHGIREVLELATDDPIPDDQIEHVKMGATVATNALLERKGERRVFVTNRGFTDRPRIECRGRHHTVELAVFGTKSALKFIFDSAMLKTTHGGRAHEFSKDVFRYSAKRVVARAIAKIYIHPLSFRIVPHTADSVGTHINPLNHNDPATPSYRGADGKRPGGSIGPGGAYTRNAQR